MSVVISALNHSGKAVAGKALAAQEARKRSTLLLESFSFSFFAVSAKRETRGPRDWFYPCPVSRTNVWNEIFPFGFYWAYLPFSSLFETLCKLLADVLHLMDSLYMSKTAI